MAILRFLNVRTARSFTFWVDEVGVETCADARAAVMKPFRTEAAVASVMESLCLRGIAAIDT